MFASASATFRTGADIGASLGLPLSHLEFRAFLFRLPLARNGRQLLLLAQLAQWIVSPLTDLLSRVAPLLSTLLYRHSCNATLSAGPPAEQLLDKVARQGTGVELVQLQLDRGPAAEVRVADHVVAERMTVREERCAAHIWRLVLEVARQLICHVRRGEWPALRRW